MKQLNIIEYSLLRSNKYLVVAVVVMEVIVMMAVAVAAVTLFVMVEVLAI